MASQVISTQEFQSYVFASYENNLSNFQSIWTEATQTDSLLWECLRKVGAHLCQAAGSSLILGKYISAW